MRLAILSLALTSCVSGQALALNRLDESNTFVCSGRNAEDRDEIAQVQSLFVTTQVWMHPNLAASVLTNGEQGVITSVAATRNSIAIAYDRGKYHGGTITISETGEGTARATLVERSKNFTEIPATRINYACNVVHIQAMRPPQTK
jgi:hypothetical protein